MQADAELNKVKRKNPVDEPVEVKAPVEIAEFEPEVELVYEPEIVLVKEETEIDTQPEIVHIGPIIDYDNIVKKDVVHEMEEFVPVIEIVANNTV